MILEVHVTPNSKEKKIYFDGDILKINIKSKPENNKANLEIIKILKKIFKEIEIIKGFKGRKKFINIPFNDINEIKCMISQNQ